MSEPREWKFRVVVNKNGPHTIWMGDSLDDLNMQPGNYHVIEKSAYDALKAERDELANQLAAWSEIEKASGRKRSEIYAMAYKLKPGKYGPAPLPELPTCSMAPGSVKVHDDVCDILEARAFNEDEVCTASVGIWAAIGLCEKLFAKERDELRAQVAEYENLIERAQKLLEGKC